MAISKSWRPYGPSRPTQLRFRGFVGFHSRRATNYFSRNSEITELRKCGDPMHGFIGHFPKSTKLGTFPPHVPEFPGASLAFIADAPQTIFLEIPKLRNYENASTQGTGLWQVPENQRNYEPSRPTQLRFRSFVGFHSRRAANYFSRNSEIAELRKRDDPRYGFIGHFPKSTKLGTFPPHIPEFPGASLAFIAFAPQTIFLEIPKLRNYENASTQGTGLWPVPENRRNYGPSRPTYLRWLS